MPLVSTLLVDFTATLTKALDLVTGEAPLRKRVSIPLASGTGADQADKIFSDQRTLTASATEDLDLAGGLTDAFGDAITFARVKAILIFASAANANNVLVGGAASNQFVNWVSDATDKIVVRPGGVFCLIAKDATGYAVTAGTGDLLRIGNSGAGTSVVYDIVIIGASA